MLGVPFNLQHKCQTMMCPSGTAWSLESLRNSKQLLVFLVYISLLLDNILLTVVVPIIPDYLFSTDNEGMLATKPEEYRSNSSNLASHNSHRIKTNSIYEKNQRIKGINLTDKSRQFENHIDEINSEHSRYSPQHKQPLPTEEIRQLHTKNKESAGSLVLVKSGHLQAMLPSNCSGHGAKFDIYSLISEDNIAKSIKLQHVQAQKSIDEIQPTTSPMVKPEIREMVDKNGKVGVLLSSKALVQLVMNPVVGLLTSHLGYHLPLFIGSISLLLAALVFAFGEHFVSLLLARSLQGVASACIGVSGMCMVAELYPDDAARSRVMGIVLGSIALGVLLGYPLGGFLYDFVDKMAPFLIIAALIFIDGVMQIFVLDLKPIHERTMVINSWPRLLSDGFVLLTAGAIWVSTSTMAILEPCLPIWLMENVKPKKWQLGTVFIPDSLGYLVGTNCFGLVAYRLGRWRVAIAAMMLVGLSAVLVPSATGVAELVLPHFGLGLGIGVVDAALVPLLASLVDSRYAAHYGSVYALQQMAVSLAYSIGPLVGGELVQTVGFPWLIRFVGIINILYCPLLLLLIGRETENNKVESTLVTSGPVINYQSSCDSMYQRFVNINDIPIIPDYLFSTDNEGMLATKPEEYRSNSSNLASHNSHRIKTNSMYEKNQRIKGINLTDKSRQFENHIDEINSEHSRYSPQHKQPLPTEENRQLHTKNKESAGSLVLVKSGHLQAMLPSNCSGHGAKFDIYSLISEDNIAKSIKLQHVQAQKSIDEIQPTTSPMVKPEIREMVDKNGKVGVLLSSKALVQLVMNPVVGLLTSHLGYHLPLFIGSISLLLAALVFAFGEHFVSLLLARSLQGVASACIGVSGMCMVAELYPDDAARSRVMGIVLGSIALGVLLGYPLGGFLYDFVDKMAPFLIIAALIFIDGVMQIFVLDLKPIHERTMVINSWPRLLSDGFVLLTAGAIWVSTSTMAILEPCLPIWLMENVKPKKWQLGTVFIPDSLGYLVGTNCFGLVAYRLGRWRVAIAAMMLVGLSAVLVPSATGVAELVLPHFGLGLGIGVVDAALVPLLASLVDSRYAAHYGSVYALQQMAVSLAYSIGPLVGGELVQTVGFPWLIRFVGIINILYCPLLLLLIGRETENNKVESTLVTSGPVINYQSSCDSMYQRFVNINDSD